jgi:LPS-assembly lipoprotein
MWWPDPRRFLAAALLCLALGAGLTGCGFHPMYGRDSAAVSAADLDTVQLPYLKEREGQMVRSFLMTNFNPDGRRRQTQFALDIDLTRSNENLGTRKDGTATRVDITLNAGLVLREAGSGKIVFRGHSVSTASYNILEARFATVSGEQDALRRAAQSLAQSISTRIAVYLKSRKKTG